MLRVGAVSDVHAPKYLDDFRRAMSTAGNLHLLLFAGDMILKGDHSQIVRVIEETRRFYKGPVFACFGNEEYEQVEKELVEHRDIVWLNDSSATVEIAGLRIFIVGSRGALDRPTYWQAKNIPGILEVYRGRIELMDRLLAGTRADLKLVVTHYSPTYATLEGENREAFPEMGCRRMEEVIRRRQPDVWFHGHGHRARRLRAEFGQTLVVNVSLPASGGITVVELPRKSGLDKFI
jgi:Icc-related predicted phosphoesterase